MEDAIQTEMCIMQAAGVIDNSHCTYTSPVFLMKSKDEVIHFCMDC